MKPWRAPFAVGASTVGTTKVGGGGGGGGALEAEVEVEDEDDLGTVRDAIRSRSLADMKSKTDLAEALTGGSEDATTTEGGSISSCGLFSPRRAPRWREQKKRKRRLISRLEFFSERRGKKELT